MATPVATQAAVAERRAEVLRMRTAAMPIAAIAAKFGVSVSTINMDLTRALEARTKALDEATGEYRSMELEKLEVMERFAWASLRRKHFKVSVSGSVARHPDTGEILLDDGPGYQAISALLRIQERRAKLLGLDAVVTAKLEVKQVDSDVDASIARLVGELAATGQRTIAGSAEVRPVETAGTA